MSSTDSSTSSDSTSAIDDKKENAQQEKTKNNIPEFWKCVKSNLKTLAKYILLSCAVLYCSRLAGQNILPLDLKKYPFASEDNNKTDKTDETSPEMPEKEPILGNYYTIQFLAQQENTLLDFLRGDKKDKNETPKPSENEDGSGSSEEKNVVSEFLSKQFISLIFYNLQALMVFFEFLSRWNENLVVILGPFFFMAFFSAMVFVGCVFFVYYYFVNFSVFSDMDAEWYVKYSVMALFVLLLICLCFVVFILQIIGLVYAMVTILTYKCCIRKKGDDSPCITEEEDKTTGKMVKVENSNVLSLLFVFVTHYQNLIMSFISILVTRCAYNYLGVTEAIASAGVVLMISSGMLGIDMFQNPKKNNSNNKKGGENVEPSAPPTQSDPVEASAPTLPDSKPIEEQGQQGGAALKMQRQTHKKNQSMKKYMQPKQFNRFLKQLYLKI
jgi:hypothetical protein